MVLAKDIRRAYATNVDFFFTNGELSIILNDEEGVLRMLTYDPSGMFSVVVDSMILMFLSLIQIPIQEVVNISCVTASFTATKSVAHRVRSHGERKKTVRFRRRSSLLVRIPRDVPTCPI